MLSSPLPKNLCGQTFEVLLVCRNVHRSFLKFYIQTSLHHQFLKGEIFFLNELSLAVPLIYMPESHREFLQHIEAELILYCTLHITHQRARWSYFHIPICLIIKRDHQIRYVNCSREDMNLHNIFRYIRDWLLHNNKTNVISYIWKNYPI